MNKKELSMLKNYEYSLNKYGTRTIWDAYDRPSYNKKREYDKICAEFSSDRSFLDSVRPQETEFLVEYAHELTVVNTNSSFFTCAYMVDFINNPTGEIIKQVLVYHTYANRYIIEL